MKPSIPRKPVCVVTSNDAHHNRYGAAPIALEGASPDKGSAFVVVFREIIHNGKLAWKKIGEARFHRHHGLHAIPYSLPSSAAEDLAACLNGLPEGVWTGTNSSVAGSGSRTSTKRSKPKRSTRRRTLNRLRRMAAKRHGYGVLRHNLPQIRTRSGTLRIGDVVYVRPGEAYRGPGAGSILRVEDIEGHRVRVVDRRTGFNSWVPVAAVERE